MNKLTSWMMSLTDNWSRNKFMSWNQLVICVCRPGSIVATFDLEFSQLINLNDVKQQLGVGLQQVEGGALVIDADSIQITGESVKVSIFTQLGWWGRVTWSLNEVGWEGRGLDRGSQCTHWRGGGVCLDLLKSKQSSNSTQVNSWQEAGTNRAVGASHHLIGCSERWQKRERTVQNYLH